MRRPIASTIVGVTLAVSACAPSEPDPQQQTSAVISNRNVDLLFMIDNSSSMRLSQTNLTTSFPAFMDAVKNLPGGLPNLHVAVISSDMGVGDGTVTGCAKTGDAGKFHFQPTGTCTATTILNGAGYISYGANGAGNFTAPDISTVFSCIAALGDTGCGFERPFASVLRALGADDRPAPSENAGFLRSDALLAIVMVTNEDDCSVRDGVNLYDVTSNTVLSSTFGPPSNYRCNEFGHICDGVRPPRLAPGGDVNATVTLNSCGSSECDGSLIPVAEFTARIKALKAAPASEVMVAAITGPATPYTVHWKAPSVADSGPWPEITHSCTASDGSFADPAVRITDLVTAFGANGAAYSICDTNFGAALQQLAARIGTLLDAGGGAGGSAGRIPNCAVTGIGGQSGAGGGGAGGASSSTGGHGPSDDGGVYPPPVSNGCGCQAGGADAGGLGPGVAWAVSVWLAGRRRRVSGPARRG